jgi:hypothetical protein
LKTGTAKRRSAPVVVPSGVFLIRISTNPFQIRRKSRRETKIQRRLVDSSSTKIIWSFNILKILSNLILTNCYQIFFKNGLLLGKKYLCKINFSFFQFLHLKKNFHDAIRQDQGSTHVRLPICDSLQKFRLENTKVKGDGASVVLECCPNLYSLGYLVFAAAGLKQVMISFVEIHLFSNLTEDLS